MPGGNIYFLWISMIFPLFTLFLILTRTYKKIYSNKSTFSMVKVSLSGNTIIPTITFDKGI